MTALVDRSGDRYGSLVVIRRSENSRDGHSKWRCACDCGNEVNVPSSNLSSGNTKSCGCLKKELAGSHSRKRSFKWAKAYERFLLMKHGASKRGHPFDLSEGDVFRISSLPCAYCGCKPKELTIHVGGGKTRKKVGSGLFANGIDRVDNSVGYTLENCVPCCASCNFMKGKMTKDNFIEQVSQIAGCTNSFDFSLVNMCSNTSAVEDFIRKAA